MKAAIHVSADLGGGDGIRARATFSPSQYGERPEVYLIIERHVMGKWEAAASSSVDLDGLGRFTRACEQAVIIE